MDLSIAQALEHGVTAHKEGKLQKAEKLYRAILQSQPKHPDANHNMGVLAVGINKIEQALPFFKTAIDSNPNIPVPEKRSKTDEKPKGLITSKILLRTLDLVGL